MLGKCFIFVRPPDSPVCLFIHRGLGSDVKWTNLNPQKILDNMRAFERYESVFPFSSFAAFMKRAGITTAYQEKPCLDPTDPLCPDSAPNKHSKQPPDVGAELTGGCYGFAGNYMHWPEDLVVGATTTNKTGHIVRAEALQSMVQLMGAKNMYEYWLDHYRLHHVDWSQEKAELILREWQNKFTQEVVKETQRLHNETRAYHHLPFSSAALDHLLRDFSEVPASRVALGYVFMVVYACVSLTHLSDSVRSAGGLGLAGVLLVAVTVAAGLGFCALLGLAFNASTTQVLPFLALGLGVDDMFLLAHTFVQTADNTLIPYQVSRGVPSLCFRRLVQVSPSPYHQDTPCTASPRKWNQVYYEEEEEEHKNEGTCRSPMVPHARQVQIRLVDAEGIINPKAFYNYLTAWVSNDALAYSASQADLRPEPRHWSHDRYDRGLKIPKSQPLVYTQLPFYLHQLGDTDTITNMINQVRTICRRFQEKGLPNFPTGVPFTFWEQYIKLRFYLVLALLAVLTAVFLVLSVVLMNVWAAALVVLLLATLVLQLFGVLGVVGVKLSAVPAVLLIVSVGVGVEFCVHVTVGFLTAVGGRDRRVILAVQHMAAPVLHGAASTLLASIMLLFSEFEFIRRYFFFVLLALTVLGVLDGLVFLPVLLSLVGPPAEVVPRNHPDRLPTPTPPPSPQPVHAHSHSGSSRRSSGRGASGGRSCRRSSSGGGGGSSLYPRLHGSNLSLTTITEEPSSSTRSSQSLRSSHEIVVEPQVVVETTTSPSTTYPGEGHHDHHVTTKVTATAKVKVELHTPLPGAVEPTYRSSSSSSSSSSNNNSGTRRSSQRSGNSRSGYGGAASNTASASLTSSSSSSGGGAATSSSTSSSKGSSDVDEDTFPK
nr:protein patched homolog 1-like [Cherax quadricarinatus]